MSVDEIVGLAIGCAFIIGGFIFFAIYLKCCMPQIIKSEQDENREALLKARAEIRQKKKLIKAFEEELIAMDREIEEKQNKIATLEVEIGRK